MIARILNKIKYIIDRRQREWDKIECLIKKLAIAQKELRMYKEFWDHSQDAMIFCRVKDGKILNVNPAGESLYGYTKEDFCKKTIFEMSADPVATTYVRDNAIGYVPFRYHINADGNKFPLSSTITYFDDSSIGRVAALIIRPINLPQEVLIDRRQQ
jgi:PAS domain S-box-containing protein